MSRRHLSGALQAAAAVAVLGYLLHSFGTGPFAAALPVLTWWSVPAAVLLGFVGTLIQAQRWRLVSRGFGMELTVPMALRGCYEASFLNAVLPGGLAGDAVRTAQQRSRHSSGWARSLGSVAGERLAGTSMVFLAAALASVGTDWRWAAVAVCVAAVSGTAAGWAARRLAPRRKLLVAFSAALGWACFAALFVLAMLLTAPAVAGHHLLALAALGIAGMSIPLGVGGWGPREGVTAAAFAVFGYEASLGITASVAYGVLALASVLPGAGLLLLRRGGTLLPHRRKIELHTNVLPKNESPHGGGPCS